VANKTDPNNVEPRVLLSVIAGVDGNQVSSIVVNHQMIPPPKIYCNILSCIITAYFKDAVEKGLIEQKDVPKVYKKLLADLKIGLSRGERYARKFRKSVKEATGEEPKDEIVEEVPSRSAIRRAGAQIRIGG
jgi:hypothetical protein